MITKEDIINELLKQPFYVKSSKGNLLACNKENGKWFAQGKEVRRPNDIEYLEKELEKQRKDLEKLYNDTMEELEYGLWDSGNLSIQQQKILDYLLENNIVVRTPGVPGEHDTANGVAKWIYTLNINEDTEREAQHNRLTNNKKSHAAKLAWKRHHASYMRGTRERERNMENRTFYGIAKELEEKLDEARIMTDNVFDKQLKISFDNLSGGIALGINVKEQTVSITTALDETGAGAFKLVNAQDEVAMENLYTNLKDDLLNLCKNFDQEIAQIIAKNGLKSTK